MNLYDEARIVGRRLRILVTRLRYLGDVIISTPVISALKRRYPESEVHYLAEEPYAPILDGNPDLDGIIPLRKGLAGSIKTINTLRRVGFTAALDLFYNPRSAVLLTLSGIPIRVGGSRRWRRRLYTGTFTVPEGIRSAVARNLYPLGNFDCEPREELPHVYLGDRERRTGADLLHGTVMWRNGRVIAIHPGGTWPAKRWRPGAFARLAAMIGERFNSKLLIVAGPGEEAIGLEVMEQAGGNSYILPLQPVRSLAAVLDNCNAVIANDGGVLHMAVALGKPTVGIFGPTEPDIWFPYEGKGPFRLVTLNETCAPCHRHYCEDMRCLDGIEPETVLSEVERVLEWGGQ